MDDSPAPPGAASRAGALLRYHAPFLVAFGLLNGAAVLAHSRFARPLGLEGQLTDHFLWLGYDLALVYLWGLVCVARAPGPSAEAPPAERRRASLRQRLRLGTLLAVGVVGLLTSEVGLRITHRYATWMEVNGRGYVSPYADEDAEEVLALEPNAVTAFEQPEFDYEVRTNAEGLWDDAHPLEKPADEYRVVALGDSFTMGQGAPFEQTWLQVLERSLAATARSKRVRVISGGVAGSDPVYCVRLFEERLLKYDPDLVLLVVNEDDLGDLIARGGFERFLPEGGVAFRDPPAMERVFASSHLLRGMLMHHFGYDHYVLRPAEREARDEEALGLMVEAAQRLQALGGHRVLVVIMPLRYQIYPHAGDTLRLWELDLAGRLRAAGVESYDLRPFLRAAIPEARVDDHFWPLDRHFKPEGYALFAAGVEQRLAEVPGFPAPR